MYRMIVSFWKRLLDILYPELVSDAGAEMGVVCCDGTLGTHSVILTELGVSPQT